MGEEESGILAGTAGKGAKEEEIAGKPEARRAFLDLHRSSLLEQECGILRLSSR